MFLKINGARTSGRIRTVKLFTFFCFIAVTTVFTASTFSPKVTGNQLDLSTDISGAELFENNCARCHGSDGTGGKGPNLASEKKQAKWKESDEKLIKKITNGGLFMPSFGKKLKPEEIQAIADHVRTLKE
jgi:mono/diheme cytochrome c family protein